MNTEEVISRSRISLMKEIPSKKDAIMQMAKSFLEDGTIEDINVFIKDINKREEEYCTYVGNETAIPHAISSTVKKAGIAFIKTEKPFPYGEQGEQVRLLFMLAIPQDSNAEHLRMLSMLATNLMHKDFREYLIQANDVDTIYQYLTRIH